MPTCSQTGSLEYREKATGKFGRQPTVDIHSSRADKNTQSEWRGEKKKNCEPKLNLVSAGQQWKHRRTEETCGHGAGRRGWDEPGEQH